MIDTEVLELLKKIDDGYLPTEDERKELLSIKEISWEYIKEIPVSIDILTNLKSLKINRRTPIEIPEYFFGNTLRRPKRGFEIKRLFKRDYEKKQRTKMDYEKKRRTKIDYEIEQLLERDLGSKRHDPELPESICNLTSLEHLNISGTNISKLPESIGNLTNLRHLYLDGVPISKLPESIGELPNLKLLVLANLTLSELPASLLHLNLEYKNKPFDFEMTEPGIYIRNLRLRNQPIEIFSQSRELIVEYYKSLKYESTSPINECKVVFLGDGGAGKSLIINRLINDGNISEDFNGESTPGICISSKKYLIGNEEIELHFWDFGGQAIMHSMHRLFLTNRTLYIIVTNARDNKANEQAWYWIRNIKSFANGAPVFLLVNQKDQNPSVNVNKNGVDAQSRWL